MITLKAFIEAVQEAIIQASDSLMQKHVGILDTYFKESPVEGSADKNLVPKTVVLEYQTLVYDEQAEGGKRVVASEIHVPLITLVPLSIPRIEKATLRADFEMSIVNGELQVEFKKSGGTGGGLRGFFKRPEKPMGCLEIAMTPQDTPEGLKLVVEAYEASLKQQIP